MEKIKKFIINLGQVVAILTMLAPLYIAKNYKQIDDYVFWMIWFILYDIYMYYFINKIEFIKNSKEHYYKYIKNVNEKLHLNVSEHEKYNSLSSFIETFFEKIAK